MTEKIKIDEIIVVEGRDDTSAIKRSVDCETIETHGYGIRTETWEMIEKAYETRGIIVFTDPDQAGDRIRRRLMERFPKAREAFMEKGDATRDGDIGIENASDEGIQKSLLKAAGRPAQSEGTFTMRDMDMWKLNGCPGASERRRALGRELGIGFAGCKTFLRRLNGFGISRKEIETLLEDLDRNIKY